MQQVESLRHTRVVGPVDGSVVYAVAREEGRGAVCGINPVALGGKHAHGRQHVGLLAGVASGEEYALLRYAVAHGKHGLEDGTAGVLTYAPHLTSGSHVHAKDRVGILQPVERELAGLDANVVQVEQALGRFLHLLPEHDTCGKLNEVELEHLAHEGERARSPQVALYHLYVVLTGKILYVERTRDAKLARYLAGDALDAAHGLHIELLRRKLYGGIARVHTGIFDVFANGIGYDFTVLCHGIHLHLLGMLYETADHHGMLLGDVGRKGEETVQLVVIAAHVHGRTGQYIRWAHQHREAHPADEGMDVLHGGERAPFWLVHTYAVQHGRELVPVLGIVYGFGTRTQDTHSLLGKAKGMIVGNLAPCGYYHPMR